MARAQYSNDVLGFLRDDPRSILGKLAETARDVSGEQKEAWLEGIRLLQKELRGMGNGRLFLEFEIPRMAKKADAVLLYSGTVFVIEFKVGAKRYDSADEDQCVDYALDLKNFHEGSHRAPVVPILVATKAEMSDGGPYEKDADGVFRVVRSNGAGLGDTIAEIAGKSPDSEPINPDEWEKSPYKPTPTIIEAALRLYAKHDVSEITRSEGGTENLGRVTATLERIIEDSKKRRRKSICFVTGVPGAGKTLIGLNLAGKRRDYKKGERAVYVSGNGPLVKVLQEALASDQVRNYKIKANRPNDEMRASDAGNSKITKSAVRKKITKAGALREVKVLVQGLHSFLSDAVAVEKKPNERIVVFDEAQRVWDPKEMDKFLKKKNAERRGMSQAGILIDTMDRHEDWAVMVCLVGGGQEINHNEEGLPQWFRALHCGRTEWDVYVPDEIDDKEHLQENSLDDMLNGLRSFRRGGLHLATSVRSFRSERVSEFVKALLDIDEDAAKAALEEITRKEYPIVITRDFGLAKEWMRRKARGTERFGVVAAAKSYRLMPHGIYVQLAVDAPSWFLNPRADPRSSYSCEYAATEFKVQGLELDWVCVAWDADLRRTGDGWGHHEFRGDKWTNIRRDEKKMYLKNAYRVLLTRARQGMVIFVPEGDPHDPTRKDEFYNQTYCYLRNVGMRDIKDACVES